MVQKSSLPKHCALRVHSFQHLVQSYVHSLPSMVVVVGVAEVVSFGEVVGMPRAMVETATPKRKDFGDGMVVVWFLI